MAKKDGPEGVKNLFHFRNEDGKKTRAIEGGQRRKSQDPTQKLLGLTARKGKKKKRGTLFSKGADHGPNQKF